MLVSVVLIAAKVALLAFVIGGTAAIVVRGVRRNRANRGDPRWNDSRSQPSHEASAHGAMPPTPRPEWVYWDTQNDK